MAPFSFIKTSTLIFAYLFLWYQTNYQHQVSALSTLKDEDVSDSNSLYSSDEDINKTHGRLKTLQSDGINDSSVRYGDYRHPQGGGEPSVRRGGAGSSASSPLKKGGGGTFPPFEDPFASLRELHANSAQWNHRRDARNVKDQFRRICKRIFCRRAMKHRCILFLILGMVALGLFVLFCGKLYIEKSDCETIKTLDYWKEINSWFTKNTGSTTYSVAAYAICTALGLLILIAFLGYNYYKARKKYIEKKKNNKIQ